MDTAIGAKRGDLVKDAESGQALLDEVETVGGQRASQMMLGTPGHEGTGDSGWIGMAVQFTFGEDMPDDDEQFTGDSGNGLGFAKAVTQGLE
jgi:hypothetical protein